MFFFKITFRKYQKSQIIDFSVCIKYKLLSKFPRMYGQSGDVDPQKLWDKKKIILI